MIGVRMAHAAPPIPVVVTSSATWVTHLRSGETVRIPCRAAAATIRNEPDSRDRVSSSTSTGSEIHPIGSPGVTDRFRSSKPSVTREMRETTPSRLVVPKMPCIGQSCAGSP